MRWWHHLVAIGLIGLLLPVYKPTPVLVITGAMFGVGSARWLLEPALAPSHKRGLS